MEKNPKIIEIRRTLWEIQDLITGKERNLIENPKNLDKEDHLERLKEFEETKELIAEVIENLEYLF